MKLIKPSYSIVEQGKGLEGIYSQIELAARNCYKSEPVEGVTPEAFVERMIKLGHLSTLEHGTVYLKIPTKYIDITEKYDIPIICDAILKYQRNPYSKAVEEVIDNKYHYFITTNYRVLVENDWLDDLKYLCEPTEFHEKRITVKFTSNIHFYKDITRHRPFSFAIESTRYCNYSKGKFGNELTFILPAWCNTMEEGDYGTVAHPLVKNRGHKDGIFTGFVEHLQRVEREYLYLIECGWQAQQAAEVLPQATKADVIMTGFISDWEHVFDLRTSIIAKTGQPHPEIARLMDPLYEEFKERGLIV